MSALSWSISLIKNIYFYRHASQKFWQPYQHEILQLSTMFLPFPTLHIMCVQTLTTHPIANFLRSCYQGLKKGKLIPHALFRTPRSLTSPSWIRNFWTFFPPLHRQKATKIIFSSFFPNIAFAFEVTHLQTFLKLILRYLKAIVPTSLGVKFALGFPELTNSTFGFSILNKCMTSKDPKCLK